MLLVVLRVEGAGATGVAARPPKDVTDTPVAHVWRLGVTDPCRSHAASGRRERTPRAASILGPPQTREEILWRAQTRRRAHRRSTAASRSARHACVPA